MLPIFKAQFLSFSEVPFPRHNWQSTLPTCLQYCHQYYIGYSSGIKNNCIGNFPQSSPPACLQSWVVFDFAGIQAILLANLQQNWFFQKTVAEHLKYGLVIPLDLSKKSRFPMIFYPFNHNIGEALPKISFA